MLDQPSEPQARPFFRWLAAMLALLMLTVAIWDLFGREDDNRWRGYVIFVAALYFGGMALTGRLNRREARRADQHPEPQARPFFRWLAAMLALLMLTVAVWELFGREDDNRWRGYVIFVAALYFGGMALTGRLNRSGE